LVEQSEGLSMREWLFLTPVAIIFYFVVFPDQFGSAMSWLGGNFFGH